MRTSTCLRGLAGIGIALALGDALCRAEVGFGPATGNWAVDANWNADSGTPIHRVPGSNGNSDIAKIEWKTVTLDSDVTGIGTPLLLWLRGSTVLNVATGGKLTVSGGVSVGQNGYAGTPTLNITGGTLTSNGGGVGATTTYQGQVIQTAGSFVSNSDFTVQYGTYTISGTTAGSTFYSSGFRIGEASDAVASFTQNGGTVTLGNGEKYIAHYSGNAGGTYALNNGAFSVSGGTFYIGRGGPGTFQMKNGTFTSTAATIVVGGEYSGGNGLFDISGGTVSLGTTSLATGSATAGKLKITGNAATITASSLSVSTANGTLQDILGPGGVSKVGVTGAVTLNGTLNVDVTGYAETGIIDLLSYTGTRTGTFGTVSILSYDTVAPWVNLLPWGSSVNDPLLMPQGYYYLNYGAASNSKVTLLFNVPEPGTLTLLVLGGLGLLRRRRRSAN